MFFYGKIGVAHIGSPFCNVFVGYLHFTRNYQYVFLLLYYILQSMIVKKFGGATIAVYPHGKQEVLNQVCRGELFQRHHCIYVDHS